MTIIDSQFHVTLDAVPGFARAWHNDSAGDPFDALLETAASDIDAVSNTDMSVASEAADSDDEQATDEISDGDEQVEKQDSDASDDDRPAAGLAHNPLFGLVFKSRNEVARGLATAASVAALAKDVRPLTVEFDTTIIAKANSDVPKLDATVVQNRPDVRSRPTNILADGSLQSNDNAATANAPVATDKKVSRAEATFSRLENAPNGKPNATQSTATTTAAPPEQPRSSAGTTVAASETTQPTKPVSGVAIKTTVQTETPAAKSDTSNVDELASVHARRDDAKMASDRKLSAAEATIERLAQRKSEQSIPTQVDSTATRGAPQTPGERPENLIDKLARHTAGDDGSRQMRPHPVNLPTAANAGQAANPSTRAGELPFMLTPDDSASEAFQVATQAASRAANSAHAITQTGARAPQAPAGTPAEQVSVQIQHGLRNQVDRINVRLHPAALGKVEVKLELAPDKTVQAVVTAERQETLDMLARDARVLQRAFEEAGLQADQNSLSFRHDSGGNDTASTFDQQGGNEKQPNYDDSTEANADSTMTNTAQAGRAAHDGVLDVEI